MKSSKDGIHCEKFAQVNAIGSNSYVDYDEHPYSGVSYYRIKSVNKSGAFSYSKIEQVYLGSIGLINLYPNPAHSALNLIVATGDNMIVNMSIWNAIGQKVKRTTLNATEGSNAFTIDVSDLATGSYVIKLVTPSGEYTTKAFLVR